MNPAPAALGVLLAMPALAQPAGWEAMLPGIAPALRACLAPLPGAMVVDAWPAEGGGLVARLRGADGARFDCTSYPGGSVTRRDPVAVQDRRPGEGLRAFMPERRCVDAWRVTDAAGRELGWLAYPGCG